MLETKRSKIISAVVGFLVLTLPQWVSAVWSLFQSEPLIPTLMQSGRLAFNPVWVTTPIGLLTLGYVAWRTWMDSRRDGSPKATTLERSEPTPVAPRAPIPGVAVIEKLPSPTVANVERTSPSHGELAITTREADGAFYLGVKSTLPKGKVRAQIEVASDSMQFVPRLGLVVYKPTWEAVSSDERPLELGESQFLPIAYQNSNVVPPELTLIVLMFNPRYGCDVVWHCPTELTEGSHDHIKFTLRLYYSAFRGERRTVERAFSVGWDGIRAEQLP